MILYTLFRENRKTMAIHVLPCGEVIVKAPVQATDGEITDFMRRKNSWVMKQLNYFRHFNKTRTCDLSSGSEFFYLGKQYQIIRAKTQKVKEYVEIGKFFLTIHSIFPNKEERINAIMTNWINSQTKKQFMLALGRCMKKFSDIPLPELRIRKLSRRWGSFLKSGTIVLNPDLIAAPKQCIEYVICHELCHFYHKDHSSAFYNLLGAKLPNWVKLKEKLEMLNCNTI